MTSGFVHGDWDHITGNMIWMGIVGIPLEWLVGPWHFLGSYFFISFMGNVTSAIFLANTLGFGASTALFGFFGALPGAAIKQKNGLRSEFFFAYFLLLFTFGTYSFVD